MADVEIHCGTLIEDYILWNKKNELEEIAKETFQIKYRGENTGEQARVSVYCEISSMIFYIYIYTYIYNIYVHVTYTYNCSSGYLMKQKIFEK